MKKVVKVLKDVPVNVLAAGILVVVGISLIPRLARKHKEEFDKYPTA